MGILKKPVIGWRTYDVSIPGLLTSSENVIVPLERAQSYCRARYDHNIRGYLPECAGAPEANCTCGFYAFKDVKSLFDSYYMKHGVIAEVYLWGTVHEYSLGYRAQYVYPKMMYAYGGLAEACMLRLAREYQVPVKHFSMQWPELHSKLEAIRQKQWEARPEPLTEKELYAGLADGDPRALKTLKARLASAICTRKKSIVRQEKELQETRDSLVKKIEQYNTLRRIKL